MKARHIAPRVLEALSDTPVVFVQGPRQAGKTTLVRSLRYSGDKAEYFTLDDAAVLAAARSDPDGFVGSLPGRVVLDEVQRAPEIFRAIKRSVDLAREPGRFLLTGSANALVLPKVSESLAGRMEVVTLLPFSQGEIEERRERFVDACFARSFEVSRARGEGFSAVADRVVRGGYPEVLSRAAPQRRAAWFRSYTTTILERDVRDLANIQNVADLSRLLRLVAARSGGVLNLTDLARDAQLPVSTLKRHFALLQAVFFADALPAWSGNPTSRLARAPKLQVVDSGLLSHLVGLDADRLRSDDVLSGGILESFVAAEIRKQASWSETRPQLLHFRTHKQQEVDIVLEDERGRVVGIEVKRTSSPGSNHFKGLRALRDAAGHRFVRGILLYGGTESVGFEKDLHALPLSALWQA